MSTHGGVTWISSAKQFNDAYEVPNPHWAVWEPQLNPSHYERRRVLNSGYMYIGWMLNIMGGTDYNSLLLEHRRYNRKCYVIVTFNASFVLPPGEVERGKSGFGRSIFVFIKL